MADRTVSVNLVLDAKRYVQGMDEMTRKTQESTRTVEQQLAAQQQAYTQVGTAATAVGVLALAGVTAAVAAYSQFDAAMDGVQAATHESAENMELLSDAALDAGQRTVYSATEAAAAIENLSRAGVSTADILNGALDGALDLAASDGLAVADAAELAASAMTQFGLAGEDVSHVADLLAAGAGKAQGGVADLGAALNQSGLVAAQMGLSIDETVGSLTAFASAGLIGSDAGTSFRAMLLRLANPTQESAQLMSDLGLSFYDAQGEFIGMEGVAGQLQDRMSGLDQETRNAALATIFGQDAIRSASILYTEGAEGIRDWTDAVDEQGYAAETAAIRLDNLKGDLEALGGAWETFMINLGAGADGPLRFGVQALTNVVEALGDMDPVMQTVILGALGLVGVVGTVGGAAMLALPQVVAFQGALVTLGITAAGTRAALAAVLTNPLVLGLAAAATAATLLSYEIEKSKPSIDEWAAALEGGADAADLFAMANQGAFEGFDFDTSEVESYLDSMRRIGDNPLASLDPSTWSLQMSNFASSLREVDEALAAADPSVMVDGFNDIVDQYGLSEDAAVGLLHEMENVRDALLLQAIEADPAVAAMSELEQTQAAYAIASGDAAVAAGDAAEATGEVEEAYTTTAEAAQEMLDAQREIVDAFFAAQDAASSYEQSVDDIAAAMAEGLAPALLEGGAGFNLAEQSGRDAASMLGDLVGSANAATDAMVANGDSAQAVAGYQATARQQIYDTAVQMGLSSDAAWAYADRLIAIPDAVTTDVTANTSAAELAISTFFTRWDGRTIRLNTATGGFAGPLAPGADIAMAGGGRIPGYAPGYDDRIGFMRDGTPIGLGGGEYIMPTLMTDRYLPMLEQMRRGTFPGYASGGRVSTPSYSPSTSVYVAAPSVAFPSTMQARLDLGGGQFVDAVMHIATEAAQVVQSSADAAGARGIRQGRRR